MCGTISELVAAAEKVAASFDADVVHPKDAASLLEKCARGKKILSALEALVAGKVAASGSWQSEGDKSPAEFVSRKTGETVRQAVDLIETAKALRELPKTDQAFRSGRLTGDQAAEIVSAATVAPKAEARLISVAENEGLIGLRQEARRVQAAACISEEEKSRRFHRQRYLRTWIAEDGAFRLSAQLTPEAGAEIKAVLDAKAKQLVKKLPKGSPRESDEALLADALLETARSGAGSSGGKVDAQVIVRVDLDSLARGHLAEGEICEVRGLGPISVSGAKNFLARPALVRMVGLRNGLPVKVQYAGRYRPSGAPTPNWQAKGGAHDAPVKVLVKLPNGEQRLIEVEPAHRWDEQEDGSDRSPP